jgi:hypothetical protein
VTINVDNKFDVVGMQQGPTGAYAQTASRGDIQSDAPEVGLTGISAKTGAAAADTMQSRDDLAKALLSKAQQPPAPAGLPPPAEAPGAIPPVPGQQLAQAAIPPAPQRQMPTPPMGEPKLPDNAPTHPDEARGYKLLAQHPDPSDPYNAAAQNLIRYGQIAPSRTPTTWSSSS